jgi:hypothetical protein
MANKTQRPRHRLRARRAARPPVDHSQRFQAALRHVAIEDAMEDLHASPCIVCDGPPAFIAVWVQAATARTIVYRLCLSCGHRARHDKGFCTVVEEKIIELEQTGNVHRFRNRVCVP